jgi:hypothetical protein
MPADQRIAPKPRSSAWLGAGQKLICPATVFPKTTLKKINKKIYKTY